MANGVTRDGGYNSYDSSGTSKYVPQVWSKKMLRNFYEMTVFDYMANQ